MLFIVKEEIILGYSSSPSLQMLQRPSSSVVCRKSVQIQKIQT